MRADCYNHLQGRRMPCPNLTMKTMRSFFWLACAPVFIWMAGCSAQAGPTTAAPAPELTPYHTLTPVILPKLPTATIPPTQAPSPTPTQIIYTIARNDTLSGIAKRFGVSLEALLAANPGMIPQALAVGQTITIPPAGQDTTAGIMPTPEPVDFGPVYCQPTGGGTACFITVHNPGPEALENISVQVTLMDGNGQPLGNQPAALPLDILPASRSLPAEVFFSGITNGVTATAQLLTSVRLAAGDGRYLKTDIQNLLVSIAWNGLSANVEGELLLPETEKPAASHWLVAVAYDAGERIVAYRRVEWNKTLQAGASQHFVLPVYSLGPQIKRVEVLVQARP